MKYLCLFAHREDHIVCGWPIMQMGKSDDYSIYLYNCVDECGELMVKSALAGSFIFLGSAGLKNGFANQMHRQIPDNYNTIKENMRLLIAQIKPDFIFTHNPWGEYGHYDHRFCFDLVYNEFAKHQIMITNIVARSSHLKHRVSMPRQYRPLYKKERGFLNISPNLQWYNQQKQIFYANNLWTHNQYLNPPRYPKDCNIYLLERECST